MSQRPCHRPALRKLRSKRSYSSVGTVPLQSLIGSDHGNEEVTEALPGRRWLRHYEEMVFAPRQLVGPILFFLPEDKNSLALLRPSLMSSDGLAKIVFIPTTT